LKIFAGLLKAAFGTFGVAGDADISSMEDEPVVSQMDHFAGDEFEELSFGRQGCFGIYGETDAGGHAEDVGIHGHVGLVVDHGGDDIGGFAADAGQLYELIDSEGYFAAEFRHEHLGHADEVFGLVVGIGDAPDVGE